MIYSVLFSDDTVFIVITVIRTSLRRAGKKSCIFVLINKCKPLIAFIVFVINITAAALAAAQLRHFISPPLLFSILT